MSVADRKNYRDTGKDGEEPARLAAERQVRLGEAAKAHCAQQDHGAGPGEGEPGEARRIPPPQEEGVARPERKAPKYSSYDIYHLDEILNVMTAMILDHGRRVPSRRNAN